MQVNFRLNLNLQNVSSNIYKSIYKVKQQKLSIERKQLSEEDIDLLTYELLPRYKRNITYASLIFVLLIPILPFFPAKHTSKTLVQSMTYDKALLISVLLVSLIIASLYYFGIYLMRKEVESGCKFVYQTVISKKTCEGNTKFIIELADRPKSVKAKIKLNKEDFYEWQKNDIIEINYLERSGEILSYKKIIQ